ncbi:MAG: phage tail sheath family protein [Candidatus Binataceae bacterium]
MPASFLHGVEIVEVNAGAVPVSVVKSAVMGLVGSAPSWAVEAPAQAPAPETPTLVSSAIDAAKFGPLIRGYTIPYAISAIQAQGAGQIIVVNVFDQSEHFTSIASTAFAFPATGAQVVNLGHMGVAKVMVKNSAQTVTYVEDADYLLDAVNGLVRAKAGGTITNGESVKIAFDYADPSTVTDAEIIGTVSGSLFTGIEALQTAYGRFGFSPKILIAPGHSQNAAVAQALSSMAEKLRSIALVDSSPSVAPADAIANRADSGESFGTSSKRAVLCYPQERFFDAGIVPTGVTLSSTGAAVPAHVNSAAVGPYSHWVAGAMAAKDLERGYWWSPSNTELRGVLGPDVALYASAVDAGSDVNELNAQGIVTVFNAFGTGLRVWGNRSAAYPSSTTPDNFISVRRTMDVIEESVQLSMLQFIDQPITNALIAAILANVNSFVRTLIQRGALVGGSASFDPAKNPPSEISAGHLVFDVDVMPPPPAERITFNVFIDTELLSGLATASPLVAAA